MLLFVVVGVVIVVVVVVVVGGGGVGVARRFYSHRDFSVFCALLAHPVQGFRVYFVYFFHTHHKAWYFA